MKLIQYLSVGLLLLTGSLPLSSAQKAPAPMYRDPVTDGAADPVLVWNRSEQTWWMLYTQRRANTEAEQVAYCYGTAIGIASSDDHGASWVYRGTLDLRIDPGHNTFWAPDIVWHNGKYHLFVAYIRGVRTHWGGRAQIVHFTSDDLWQWNYEGTPQLSSERVIDPTLLQTPDGTWHMWYKDETRGAVTMHATSRDLFHWQCDAQPAIGGRAHEGAKAFRWKGRYWMLTDQWRGMQVYCSDDLRHWEPQGVILDTPGSRRDDTPQGAHGEVVVCGEQAYVIYFTHPGRTEHTAEHPDPVTHIIPFAERRSSIQAAELRVVNDTLRCDRNADFDFYLSEPKH